MINIKINQDNWVLKVLEKEEHESKFPDTMGITDSDQKTIYLNKAYLMEKLVRHELTHAFYYSIIDKYTPDDLSKDQIEEIFCTLFEYHGEEILVGAKQIYNMLTEKKEEVNESEAVTS